MIDRVTDGVCWNGISHDRLTNPWSENGRRSYIYLILQFGWGRHFKWWYEYCSHWIYSPSFMKHYPCWNMLFKFQYQATCWRLEIFGNVCTLQFTIWATETWWSVPESKKLTRCSLAQHDYEIFHIKHPAITKLTPEFSAMTQWLNVRPNYCPCKSTTTHHGVQPWNRRILLGSALRLWKADSFKMALQFLMWHCNIWPISSAKKL